MITSRRAWLQGASATVASGLLMRTPRWQAWTEAAGRAAEPDDAWLRSMAHAALDAARAAGATFADVRVGTGQFLTVIGVWAKGTTYTVPPEWLSKTGYSVRAIVDGAWGFASGMELTTDGIAAAARTAVDSARANRPRRPRRLELAPAPVVPDGRWETPIAEDPFNVSIDEQGAFALAALEEAKAVPGVSFLRCGLTWQRSRRVFASTDGTLVTQHVMLALPSASAQARAESGATVVGVGVDAAVPRGGGYGYEAVRNVPIATSLREAGELAVEQARRALTARPLDVGRYDLVLGRSAAGSLLAETVVPAVNLERAQGYYANWLGTSYAAPPEAVLGTYHVGSPLLSVRADGTQPHGAATLGWDDEGIAPDAYTFVDKGVITDYHTNRQMAPILADWYRRRGESPRSHGCGIVGDAMVPNIAGPNISLQPGSQAASLADLIADTKRGVYVERTMGATDQQLLSGQYVVLASAAREIRNGKLGSAVARSAFQFVTPTFWKSMDAVGDASTAGTQLESRGPLFSDPLQIAFYSLDAVPVRIRQVNMLDVGRLA